MAGISKVGKKGLQDGALTTTAASVPTVGAKGELFYNTTENKLYVSNGTAWTRVSNDSPSSTGGTVVISTLNEGATFSYNLGTNFTDDANTDAELTYSLESGTLPGGATLPTAGNSAMTGTVGNVSSNTVYTFSIRATDVAGATATQDYQQTINTVAATTTGGTVTISAVNEGSSASYDVDTNFTFTTGSTFSAYSLLSGSLPSGLSFNTSTGVISGTMGTVSADTAYSFTIRGTDTDGDTVDQAYSWTITDTPFSATGGTITTSGGYKYHTFTSSASGASGFVPNMSGSVDYLIVAGGGGGGGSYVGGGGGAGGYLTATGASVTAQQYTITVGNGGTGPASGVGSSGGNSSFLSITAIGGGGGGTGSSTAGSGGSGGGSGAWGSPSNYYGSGTTGQGNRGGSGWDGLSHFTPGGGGGGATAVGGNSGTSTSNTSGGAGGTGSNSRSAWATVTSTGDGGYYAGGGGGGTDNGGGSYSGSGGGGGAGGGGTGADKNLNSTTGTANTGGGGGGGGRQGSTPTAGANGGSGIVIIRYAV